MERLRLADFLLPGDACHVARTTFRPDDRGVQLHDHDFHELFWVEAGAIHHRTPAGEEILSAGHLTFIRPRDAHALNAAREAGTIVNIAFPSRPWRLLVARYAKNDPLYGVARRRSVLNAAQLRAIEIAAAELLAGARSRLSLDCFLLRLLGLIDEPSERGRAAAPLWLADAVMRLAEPKFAAAGVAAIVDAAGRSPEHVARSCRAVYGKSPTDLVTEARLGHAATALSASDASVVQVAADCGFETLSHFYACFVSRYGTPPATWRRRQHQIVRPRARK